MTDLTALSYTSEHEWISLEGDIATVGITDFAADKLGDVVFVELPGADSAVTAGDVCGEIESTKSVGELYAPLTGTVVEVNDAVVDDRDERSTGRRRLLDVGDDRLLDAEPCGQRSQDALDRGRVAALDDRGAHRSCACVGSWQGALSQIDAATSSPTVCSTPSTSTRNGCSRCQAEMLRMP